MGNRPQPLIRLTIGPNGIAMIKAATPDQRIALRVWLAEAAAEIERDGSTQMAILALLPPVRTSVQLSKLDGVGQFTLRSRALALSP